MDYRSQADIKPDYKFCNHFRDSYIQHHLDMVDKFINDPSSITRRANGLCVYCFYETFMAGQAFTQWKCVECGTEAMHHTTHIPRLCKPCADKLGACCQCAADREWKSKQIIPS